MAENEFKMANEGLRYLTNLQEQIKETDTNYTPQEPVGAKETVVHVGVPDDLKRAFILGMRLKIQATKMQIDRMIDNSIDETAIEKLKSKSNVLSELFWSALRAEYNCYAHDIGLRKDWTVVEFESGHSSDKLKRLLEGLGGIDIGDLDK
jgi:hypothetical protein